MIFNLLKNVVHKLFLVIIDNLEYSLFESVYGPFSYGPKADSNRESFKSSVITFNKLEMQEWYLIYWKMSYPSYF